MTKSEISPARLREAITRNGLDALPVVSRDPLEVQARAFAKALRDYAVASAKALTAGDIRKSDEAHDRYQLAALLYAPCLIEALATAFLESGAGA